MLTMKEDREAMKVAMKKMRNINIDMEVEVDKEFSVHNNDDQNLLFPTIL